jgi:hypothetical protein
MSDKRTEMARNAMKLLESQGHRELLAGVGRTAMKNLAQAAEQAVCLDEILLALMYQQARYPSQWRTELVTQLLEMLKSLTGGTKDEREKARMAAQQFGILTRAQVVAEKGSRAGNASRGGSR